MQQVAPAQIDLFATKFNNKLPLFVSPVPDSLATAVDALNSSHLGQSGGEGDHMQENHSDCSGVAQHALVLGSSGHVQPNPTEPAQSAQAIDTAFQSDPSQKSNKSKSPCMAPRASAIKGQGFSEPVTARIEAPQRGSTKPDQNLPRLLDSFQRDRQRLHLNRLNFKTVFLLAHGSGKRRSEKKCLTKQKY